MGLLGLITGMLPMVSNIVQSVEVLFGPKNGEKKKQAAVAAVSDVVNILGTTGVTSGINSGLLMEGIGDVIEGVVKINNATGVFKRA